MREKPYRRTAEAVRLYFAKRGREETSAEGTALHVCCRDDGSLCRKTYSHDLNLIRTGAAGASAGTCCGREGRARPVSRWITRGGLEFCPVRAGRFA